MMNEKKPLGLMAIEGMGLSTQQEAEYMFSEEPVNEGLVADEGIDELAQSSDDADQLISVVKTLDGISNTLVVANAQQGISEHTATALNAAVEHLCISAGVPKSTVFCLENFGGFMARKQATSIAIESLTSVIKAVIDKILKWLKVVMNYVQDTLQELMQGADNMVERCQHVRSLAKGIAHKTIKEGNQSINNSEMIRFFTHKGKIVEADHITEIYAAYSGLMGKDFSGFLKEMSNQINTAVAEAKDGDTKEETLDKAHKLIIELKTRAFSHFKETVSEPSHDTLTYDLPFGQRSLLVSLGKEESKYTGLSVVMEKTKDSKSPVSKDRLATLDYAQIMALLQAIEKEMLFGLYKDYKNTKDALSKIERMVIRGCDDITKTQQKSEATENGAVTYSVHFLKELVASVIKMTVEIHRYDIVVVKQLLTYCSASIKMHS